MVGLGVLAGWAVALAQPAEGPGIEGWLGRAQDAQARGLIKQAIEFAGQAIIAQPADPRGYYFRAQLLERTRQWPLAIADLNRALELRPGEPALHLQRGLVGLQMGEFGKAVEDFDRYAALRPDRGPALWQRGIALFYLGRYAEARDQFKDHRTVNPRDVENSAWHFACVAKLEGVESARRQWLPVEGDARVPMKEVQALMTGKAAAEAVLQAAEAVKEPSGRARATFYAHLYLALAYGAEGQTKLEARHIAAASKGAEAWGLMGIIAQLHADWVAGRLRPSAH